MPALSVFKDKKVLPHLDADPLATNHTGTSRSSASLGIYSENDATRMENVAVSKSPPCPAFGENSPSNVEVSLPEVGRCHAVPTVVQAQEPNGSTLSVQRGESASRFGS